MKIARRIDVRENETEKRAGEKDKKTLREMGLKIQKREVGTLGFISSDIFIVTHRTVAIFIVRK